MQFLDYNLLAAPKIAIGPYWDFDLQEVEK